jgi:hypothetical protein
VEVALQDEKDTSGAGEHIRRVSAKLRILGQVTHVCLVALSYPLEIAFVCALDERGKGFR